MIGILHAYSRSNAGDGLLVDLTVQRVGRATSDEVVLAALDPHSFPEISRRVHVGTRGRGLSAQLVRAAGRSLAVGATGFLRRPLGSAVRDLAGCRAFVAVGGGYLRAVDTTSSVGTLLNHVPQLLLANRTPAPTLYLPQSVGPLRGPVGSAVVRQLRGIDAVCVRDDHSLTELNRLSNVHRISDLAVLDIAERWDEIEPVGSDGPVGIVARQVGHADGYESALFELADKLGQRAAWSVQTTGDQTKSDGAHYANLGVEVAGHLTDMLAARQLSVVVSVRLHGALMALEAGVPAIHLAYDRKGPAAYSDLGLSDWCFDVRSLDSASLIEAVRQLLEDPAPYWDRVDQVVPGLREQSRRLDDLVRSTVGSNGMATVTDSPELDDPQSSSDAQT